MIEFLNNPPAWSAPLIATPIVIALFAVVVVGSWLLDKALRRFVKGIDVITTLKNATCKGGWLRHFGLGWTDHFFSNDYGGDQQCWRKGCDATWDWHDERTHIGPWT